MNSILFSSNHLRVLSGVLLAMSLGLNGQTKPSNSPFQGLAFRSIGPAFMSGRIADIAIDPKDENTWYVAVGSGGVWKTTNRGISWQAIFDTYPSYSTGALAIDKQNSHRIWLGTGENVGGRHVGYGDGIYLSENGGQSWTNKGLPDSEHISKIIIHPTQSNTIWVAAQGPLWTKGGQRGVYKSTDGGETWERTLAVNEWTGATDLLIDPRNPDRLYAATWQRHRTVAAYLGGGPGSGLYRSDDGGLTWQKLQEGLPTIDMGKIGLALSAHNPDVVYAAIEGYHREGGVYRSTNRGASWSKQSDAVSGATGPHYYQELYTSPHHEHTLYLMDVRAQISEDGGQTFSRMNEQHKHSDNHALAFGQDPDYLLMGTDGGLYESYDRGENWRFISNLPLTQFYKLAVDDAEPFYHILGGTQDNNTQWGPSRTDNPHGIQNRDWKIILGGDGHQPAFEPGNPNIAYAQWQEGHLNRVDLHTGERMGIQPQPGAEEPAERFNWDAPILVSPHDSQRIYFASQRLWRSDDRGDSWQAISPDLTRNQERITLPIMGESQGWDNAWDLYAMSNYNTITAIAESPIRENEIMVGTDDGKIHYTSNGGESWQEIKRSKLPGAPDLAYVNDIKADRFDSGTFYVALDHHKYGDFKPYLYQTQDGGKSWKSLSANLPDRHLIWRLVQDPVQANVLFLGTEYGVMVSTNGGENWEALRDGMPTIPVRDLTIQTQHDDLVCATFGRGFYIFDDIAVFREYQKEDRKKEARLYSLRDAFWYVPRPILSSGSGKGSQGSSHYSAPNPPFGATFTYHLSQGLYSQMAQRQKREKEQKKKTFPGWEILDEELREVAPRLELEISDSSGKVCRRLPVASDSGFHRVTWDLRLSAKQPLQAGAKKTTRGPWARPGSYQAQLVKVAGGQRTTLTEKVHFAIRPLYQGSIENPLEGAKEDFRQAYDQLRGQYTSLARQLKKIKARQTALSTALQATPRDAESLYQQWQALHERYNEAAREIEGLAAQGKIGEKVSPRLRDRMYTLERIINNSSYGPTGTAMEQLAILQEQIPQTLKTIETLAGDQQELTHKIEQNGGPKVEP